MGNGGWGRGSFRLLLKDPRRTPPPLFQRPPGQRQKKVCVPKIGLKFPVHLINFVFCRRKSFLMWVGGWVGRGWPGPQTTPPMQ